MSVERSLARVDATARSLYLSILENTKTRESQAEELRRVAAMEAWNLAACLEAARPSDAEIRARVSALAMDLGNGPSGAGRE